MTGITQAPSPTKPCIPPVPTFTRGGCMYVLQSYKAENGTTTAWEQLNKADHSIAELCARYLSNDKNEVQLIRSQGLKIKHAEVAIPSTQYSGPCFIKLTTENATVFHFRLVLEDHSKEQSALQAMETNLKTKSDPITTGLALDALAALKSISIEQIQAILKIIKDFHKSIPVFMTNNDKDDELSGDQDLQKTKKEILDIIKKYTSQTNLKDLIYFFEFCLNTQQSIESLMKEIYPLIPIITHPENCVELKKSALEEIKELKKSYEQVLKKWNEINPALKKNKFFEFFNEQIKKIIDEDFSPKDLQNLIDEHTPRGSAITFTLETYPQAQLKQEQAKIVSSQQDSSALCGPLKRLIATKVLNPDEINALSIFSNAFWERCEKWLNATEKEPPEELLKSFSDTIEKYYPLTHCVVNEPDFKNRTREEQVYLIDFHKTKIERNKINVTLIKLTFTALLRLVTVNGSSNSNMEEVD